MAEQIEHQSSAWQNATELGGFLPW